jgi:hypothetical protein
MTLTQFSRLQKEEQIAIIKKEGIFLFIRQECGIDIILYQIDGFYVEVFFEAANNHNFRIRSFDDTAALDAYLQDINLSEIRELL